MAKFFQSLSTWLTARVGRRNQPLSRSQGPIQTNPPVQTIGIDPSSKAVSRRRVHWSSNPRTGDTELHTSLAAGNDSPPSQPYLIIIISLSYPNWSGGSATLVGPKSDLRLLLDYLRYRHTSDPRRFVFLTDFDFEYTDSSGFTDILPMIPATKRNIQTVLQGAMEGLRMGDKCLIYYDGHVDVERPLEHGHQPPAYLVTTDEQRIHDRELREWLRESRQPNSTIIAVFDAVNSGGFLGLPYAYDKQKKRELEGAIPSTEPMTSQVIEIAAARKMQPPLSGSSGGERTLTWYLIQYLQTNPQADLAGLASYLYAHCKPSGSALGAPDQEETPLPLLSCSRKLDGRVALF